MSMLNRVLACLAAIGFALALSACDKPQDPASPPPGQAAAST